MPSLRNYLPSPVRNPFDGAHKVSRIARHFGRGAWCPVCEHESRSFGKSGNPPRPDSRCPWCGSRERHRMVWPYLKSHTNLFDGNAKRMLHIAPEPCFEPKLRQALGSGYVTGDLLSPRAMLSLDICDLPFKENWFDVILCSHVLEHVPDDRQAMREFRRVLSPDGWAALLVPIRRDATHEDPSITDPAERLRVFGQSDHVRRYGPDIRERLEESGFDVTVLKTEDLYSAEESRRMRLAPHTAIHMCRKQAA